MTQYLPILVMGVLATVFVAASFTASRALAPHLPTAAKHAPYECGIVPEREPAERFPVKFALVAMAFIMFDVELVFLYAWASIFRRLELFGLVAMGIFLLPLVVSYCYELSSGSLDWGPSRAAKRAPQPVQRLPAGSRDTAFAGGTTATVRYSSAGYSSAIFRPRRGRAGADDTQGQDGDIVG